MAKQKRFYVAGYVHVTGAYRVMDRDGYHATPTVREVIVTSDWTQARKVAKALNKIMEG